MIGKWGVPEELLNRYIRLIIATEHNGARYNYEFDERRRIVHSMICEYVGLMVHMEEYGAFQNALEKTCMEMIPTSESQQEITKVNPPCGGLTSPTKQTYR